MKFRKIGLRSTKTIIAVAICFGIAQIFPELGPGMMSAAAITAINVSIFNSFRSSFDRVAANLVAIFMAYLLLLSGQTNFVGAAIAMTAIVLICNIFNWQYSIGNAAIFFVFVVEVPYYASQDFSVYAANRVMDTLLGTMVGLVVNALIFRPKQEKFMLNAYRDAYVKIREDFKNLISYDIAVDEYKLIDIIHKMNETFRNLDADIKLKFNENVNTITVFKLNNLFRMAISLLIELNDIEERPVISKENEELLMFFFKGDFEHIHQICESPSREFDVRYNYEVKKLVHTLESIEYNIGEFSNRYYKSKQYSKKSAD